MEREEEGEGCCEHGPFVKESFVLFVPLADEAGLPRSLSLTLRLAQSFVAMENEKGEGRIERRGGG